MSAGSLNSVHMQHRVPGFFLLGLVASSSLFTSSWISSNCQEKCTSIAFVSYALYCIPSYLCIYVLYMPTYIHTYISRVSISEQRLTGVVTGSVSLPSESPSKSMHMQKVLEMRVRTYVRNCLQRCTASLACINWAWHSLTHPQWAGETSSGAEHQRCSEMMSSLQSVEVSKQRGLPRLVAPHQGESLHLPFP